jgi:hypothetical protein
MTPRKPQTPRNVPPIDWPNLTDKALEEFRMLVETEREHRWSARLTSCATRAACLTPCTQMPSTPTTV